MKLLRMGQVVNEYKDAADLWDDIILFLENELSYSPIHPAHVPIVEPEIAELPTIRIEFPSDLVAIARKQDLPLLLDKKNDVFVLYLPFQGFLLCSVTDYRVEE